MSGIKFRTSGLDKPAIISGQNSLGQSSKRFLTQILAATYHNKKDNYLLECTRRDKNDFYPNAYRDDSFLETPNWLIQ